MRWGLIVSPQGLLIVSHHYLCLIITEQKTADLTAQLVLPQWASVAAPNRKKAFFPTDCNLKNKQLSYFVAFYIQIMWKSTGSQNVFRYMWLVSNWRYSPNLVPDCHYVTLIFFTVVNCSTAAKNTIRHTAHISSVDHSTNINKYKRGDDNDLKPDS